MESRLKKLNTSKVRKVYCIMMKLKKTSLSKNKIISKLLQPLQKNIEWKKKMNMMVGNQGEDQL